MTPDPITRAFEALNSDAILCAASCARFRVIDSTKEEPDCSCGMAAVRETISLLVMRVQELEKEIVDGQ